MSCKVGLDVKDRQPEHEQEAGQHESETGEEAAELAASDSPEVDAQLVRLRTGKDLVDGQGFLEGLFVDPALLVDALLLDHRDLGCRAAPGERTELQESNEDRARRIMRRPGRPLLGDRHRAGQSPLSGLVGVGGVCV